MNPVVLILSLWFLGSQPTPYASQQDCLVAALHQNDLPCACSGGGNAVCVSCSYTCEQRKAAVKYEPEYQSLIKLP